MALQKILHNVPDTPYSRPSPVHITVLEIKEQIKVLTLAFHDSEARPSESKTNLTAIISDGTTVTKITLFEAFASKVKKGQAYMIRGYSLRGDCPPFWLNITRDTVFFRSTPLEVSAALREEAAKLLCPPSPFTPLSGVRRAEGPITVQGEVVEFSKIKKVQVRRDAVPLRTVTLKEDKSQVSLNLWREAAVFPLQVGEQIRLTHLKGSDSSYGFRLQSTADTVLEDTVETLTVGVLGATEVEGRPGVLQLLVEDDEVFHIEEALWQPIERTIKKMPFYIKVAVSGKVVTAAEACAKEE